MFVFPGEWISVFFPFLSISLEDISFLMPLSAHYRGGLCLTFDGRFNDEIKASAEIWFVWNDGVLINSNLVDTDVAWQQGSLKVEAKG